MAKLPNYLASPLERQQQFKLPEQHKIAELINLTQQVKQAWAALLPDEILSTLMVVQYASPLLVITTTNHTIANHLNYTNRMLLALLQGEYASLQTLSQIKFRVINAPHYHSNKPKDDINGLSIESNQNVNYVTSRKLTPTTKQNITQLAKNVTLNPRLSSILLRLADG